MRDGLRKLNDGKHYRFTATYTNQTRYWLKNKSIVLKDLTYNGDLITGHVWVKVTEAIKKLSLRHGERITFLARVKMYRRIRPNIKQNKAVDYGLTDLYNVEKVIMKKEEKKMTNNKKYEIITYKSGTIKQDVKFDFENRTIWLNQSEIANIANSNVKTISRKIIQIQKEGIIDLQSSKMRITQNDKKVNYYNSNYLFALNANKKEQELNEFLNWAETVFRTRDFENYKIVRFTQDNLSLEVRFTNDYETVWLSQDEIAELYQVTRENITIHIKNIFEQGELEKVSVSKFFLHTGQDNKKYEVEYFNLDMILAIGYRVNSKQGIAFRRWANKILKDYLIKGYAINERRLNSLGKTVQIQNRMLSASLSIDFEELSKVINEYTDALTLLDDYDHQRIKKPKGRETIYQMSYDDARQIIDSMDFNKTSTLFGKEKEEGKLEGILAAVFQNVFGQEVYPTLEDKAAHLLYFLVKDHPFYDGCKRIAATLFLNFLYKNNALTKNGHLTLSNDALVAITLLTAESNPEEMDIIVSVIMNLLVD